MSGGRNHVWYTGCGLTAPGSDVLGEDDMSSFTMGRDDNVTDSYLETEGGVPSNLAGHVVPWDAYIVAITAATEGAETWTAEVRKNDSAAVIASLAMAAVAKNQAVYGVSVSAGDELQVFCNGIDVNRPVVTVYLRKA